VKISVCLASYNGAKYIHQQLSSIVTQLRDGDEVLVADDGSTDETLSLIRNFGPPVMVIATDRVGGVVGNFERILKIATGEGIVLCDQDDVWLPGRADLIRSNLQHCSLLLMNGRMVDANLNPMEQTVFEYLGNRRGFFSNLWKNGFMGCCMAFRSELRDRVIPFPASVPWHDWYIGLVAELTGKVVRIDTVTLLYRRHGSNASPTGEGSQNSLLKRLSLRFSVLLAVLVAVSFREGKCK
jgi:glycosyltransferase involved in cell wall biosynthesis